MRIGEVARRTGLTTRTLRHYDDLGLLVPSGRTEGDYRLYSLDDVNRLLAIQHLKSLGLGLHEIGAALDEPGFDPDATLRRHIDAVEERIAAEEDLLARLRRLLAASHEGWDDVLDAIALSERLRHPEASVRFRATLDAPGAIGLDELIGMLRDDPEAGVREVATWALAQRGPDALEAVRAHLADPDAGVRHQMAHVLGKLRDPRAAGALATLLEDPDADVVAKAAFSLGQIGGGEAAAALAGTLGRGPATLRATVVTALGRLGAEAVAPVVAVLAAEDRSTPAARADAAEALGLLEDPAAADPLAAATTDPAEEVRLAALMALASLPGSGSGGAEAIAAATAAEGRTGTLARALAARTP